MMKIFSANEEVSKMVTKSVDNEHVRFFGFVKMQTNLWASEAEDIADKLLDSLYSVWTERYDRLYWITHSCEFRYESLKRPEMVSFRLMRERNLDPDKVNMSMTAVCSFPDKKKAFWLNTGSDAVYAATRGRVLRMLTDNTKRLKTVKAQSIFSADKNYTDNAEGAAINRPKSFVVVTKECQSFFENCVLQGTGVSQEMLEAFAYGEKKPMIIGEIFVAA